MRPPPAICRRAFLSTPSARRATPVRLPWWCQSSYFYPRPPRGGRHLKHGLVLQYCLISIHALREEGDDGAVDVLVVGQDISIHALREEGDNRGPPEANDQNPISIHALREEGDKHCLNRFVDFCEFLSTPSARRATTGDRLKPTIRTQFLSTPSARRATSTA